MNNFGETLGFDMESIPSFDAFHKALLNDNSNDAEDGLLSVIIHLLICAIDDPGLPSPSRHTTILGQNLKQVR